MIRTPSEALLQSILSRTTKLTFSKSEAIKIVGGEKRLLTLIANGKLDADKSSSAQNGKWRFNASQVLANCRYTK